jgi:phosphonoacetate hydrolase
MPARIGDLVVLADSLTVFGNLDRGKAEEVLLATYRTHGSEYEQDVPLFIFNNRKTLPPASYFQYNKDLTAWLIKR